MLHGEEHTFGIQTIIGEYASSINDHVFEPGLINLF